MARFARAVAAAAGPGDVVALLAVLGVRRSGVWRQVAEVVGRDVCEIPLPPPSVPGLRLYEALLALVRAAGVRIVTGSRIVGRTLDADAVLDNKLARYAMEKVVGVHRGAPMPTARTQSLHTWLKKRPAPAKAPTRGALVYFHGCAGGYFEVDAARKAIEVLEHLGYQVLVPPQGCCGLAEQSNGLFEQATKSVRALVKALRSAGTDLTIVSTAGTAPACSSTRPTRSSACTTPNWPTSARGSGRSRSSSWSCTRRASCPPTSSRSSSGCPTTPPASSKPGHGDACVRPVRADPRPRVVGNACCGIAGTTASRKRRSASIAQAVGKPLFDMVKQTEQGLAACDTETCRWQIENSTGVRTVHPIVLVHQAYGLGAVTP